VFDFLNIADYHAKLISKKSVLSLAQYVCMYKKKNQQQIITLSLLGDYICTSGWQN